MCGIVGRIYLSNNVPDDQKGMEKALDRLSRRGPDASNSVKSGSIHFGHTRLSIIDTSAGSNQPFLDPSGRYCLVFNGEIFNYKSLKSDLMSTGVRFRTNSDTEVLLYLLIKDGEKAINKLNGFFAFAFYDLELDFGIIARDRYGIKPLVYFQNDNQITFASEIKALNPFIGKREIDKSSLQYFFQFNYIPAPYTILDGVCKLTPGHYLKIENQSVVDKQYYTINRSLDLSISYTKAKNKVYDLMHAATERRMISDVPLGAFLSGGIDSSIVSTIAAKYNPNLHTFSIGFKDEPYFDETEYAEIVARKIGSNHTVFSLSNDDLLNHYDDALTYLDEPFADSSALNMYILSKETKQSVTVALSGDGADELFSGYNKHSALWQADNGGIKNHLIKSTGGFASSLLPKTRDSKFGNLGRKLKKFSDGLNLSQIDRYLAWASFMGQKESERLANSDFKLRKGLDYLMEEVHNFNDYLFRDFRLVLEGDMLRKVDAMSMANSLEVRSPFLDVELVDYIFGLPSNYKIDGTSRKKILKEAFKQELPSEIFNRSKQGFEVPLKKWFQNELKSTLDNIVFNKERISEEGLLEWDVVQKVQTKLYSSNSGDTIYNVWALLSFQKWYDRYLKEF